MKCLIKQINQSKYIWILLVAIIVVATIFSFCYSKADSFEMLTSYHNNSLDSFFTWFTYLGDGFFIVAVSLFLFLFRKKILAFGILLSYAISGLLVQLLKNIIFSPRPAVLFKQMGRPFYEVHDVTLLSSNASFPSGHTTSAFALLSILVLFYPKQRWNYLFLLLAIMVGYSRIYLSNHFLVDVLAGAIIGIITAFGCYILLQKTLIKRN